MLIVAAVFSTRKIRCLSITLKVVKHYFVVVFGFELVKYVFNYALLVNQKADAM